jgi:hypothetical protein
VADTVIGIVGYFEFVRGYPLGPETMQRLRGTAWPHAVEIREMNWGPVAIVQEFQALAHRPDRVVLMGALDRGLPHGTVTCRRWVGGPLDTAAVQRRMFEAVTGIISLDNLLVIGSHFGIWPEDTFTVELQWPESGLSDLVLDEAASRAGRGGVVGERPLSAANEQIVRNLVRTVQRLAMEPSPVAESLGAEQLTPVAAVAHYRFHDDQGLPQ